MAGESTHIWDFREAPSPLVGTSCLRGNHNIQLFRELTLRPDVGVASVTDVRRSEAVVAVLNFLFTVAKAV
jgi:hypothetical protein